MYSLLLPSVHCSVLEFTHMASLILAETSHVIVLVLLDPIVSCQSLHI